MTDQPKPRPPEWLIAEWRRYWTARRDRLAQELADELNGDNRQHIVERLEADLAKAVEMADRMESM
jgi:hypothetical protein